MNKLIRFLKDEQGASAVEYGILVGLIAAVIIGVIIFIGGKTNNAFNSLNANMTGAPFVTGS
jgi:pilus assembly protein Flp/PilA